MNEGVGGLQFLFTRSLTYKYIHDIVQNIYINIYILIAPGGGGLAARNAGGHAEGAGRDAVPQEGRHAGHLWRGPASRQGESYALMYGRFQGGPQLGLHDAERR